jgi:hypothetical protein
MMSWFSFRTGFFSLLDMLICFWQEQNVAALNIGKDRRKRKDNFRMRYYQNINKQLVLGIAEIIP